jgi:hypothetical protein
MKRSRSVARRSPASPDASLGTFPGDPPGARSRVAAWLRVPAGPGFNSPSSGSVSSLLAALFFVLATVAMTWPLARDIRTAVPNHDDAYFHMWRIAWVAHQLPRAPLQLFDANIFLPTRDTLAMSDAALLQGLVAAPAIWLGVRTVLIYNVLLLGSMAASAWCAYLFAMRLTGAPGASLLAGFVFGFGPYKLAHVGHLEMQASMWMPLAFWAVHCLAFGPGESSDRRETTAFRGAGVALGAALAMQALSALYYFMFLTMTLGAMVVVLFAVIPPADRWRLARGLVVAAIVTLAVVLPYSRPYSRARLLIGTRSAGEVAQFSGRVGDYARGGLGRWQSEDKSSGEERILSPGLVAPALALVALWPPVNAWGLASAVGLAVAFDGSLGTNGYLFGAARQLVPALDGLRAAARFAVVVLLFLALMAAVGFARLLRNRGGWTTRVAAGAALAACAIDFWAAPIALRHPITRPTELTVFLASLPPGTPVLHLPVPKWPALWAHETTYQYWSTFHWQPLVNGYSAYAPPTYMRTLRVLRDFPDAESVGRLRRLGVKYVVVHPELFGGRDYPRIAAALADSGDLELAARFTNAPIEALVYRLKPDPGASADRGTVSP